MRHLQFAVITLCAVSAALGENVLLGGMHASRSHLGSMLPLGLRIAKDGHAVHFLESYSEEPFAFPANITVHHFRTPQNELHKIQLTTAAWRKSFTPDVMVELFLVGDDAFLKMQKLHPRKMAQLLDSKWNLTVVDELFGIAMYGIAAYHHDFKGTPYIVHSTTTMLHPFAWKLGLGRPLHYRPSFWFPYNDNLHYDVTRFRMRLRAIAHAFQSAFGIDFTTQFYGTKGIKQIGVKHFDFHRFWIQQAYNFHDDLENFAFPAPISNEVVHIGRFCKQPRPLEEQFRAFVEDPRSKGTILMAFGTNVYWKYATKYILNAFFDALNELNEYRIVFAYNGLKPNQTVGSHVMLIPWCPQVDILNHPSTKLFLTHGGMKSLREAICSSTPMIVLPLAAEQTHNGAAVLEMGIAQMLNKFTLTSKKLVKSIRDVIGNASYKRNSAKINRMFLDTPMPELDVAAFYTKRAIRLGNRKTTFRIEGAVQSWPARLYLIEMVICALLIAVLCQ